MVEIKQRGIKSGVRKTKAVIEFIEGEEGGLEPRQEVAKNSITMAEAGEAIRRWDAS